MSDRFFMAVGPLFIVAMIAFRVTTYGTQWTFGRYGMPQTLLASDGMHYPNGEPVIPLMASLARSGWEPEIYLVGVSVVIVCVLYVVYVARRMDKQRREYLESVLALEQEYRRRRSILRRARPSLE
jgi:hypothetical protein